MSLKRRHVILGFGALCATVGTGLALRYSYKDEVLTALSRAFGRDVAASSAASDFAEDLVASFTENGIVPDWHEIMINRASHVLRSRGYGRIRNINAEAVSLFAMSTNVVLAYERGDALEYFGLFDPYNEGTCANALSAMLL